MPGTIACKRENRNKKNGRRDEHGHNFGPFNLQGHELHAQKHPDGSFDVRVRTPEGKDFRLSAAQLPDSKNHDLHVGVTWTDQAVTLYLDGKPAATAPSA